MAYSSIDLTGCLLLLKHRRFSVKKCAGCTQGISSKELVMRARDNVYHVGCFACDRCKRILSTGEYFGMRAMRVYCKTDYEVVLREESQNVKARHGPGKGRPRKRRLTTAAAATAGIDGVGALTGERARPSLRAKTIEVLIKRTLSNKGRMMRLISFVFMTSALLFRPQ